MNVTIGIFFLILELILIGSFTIGTFLDRRFNRE